MSDLDFCRMTINARSSKGIYPNRKEKYVLNKQKFSKKNT